MKSKNNTMDPESCKSHDAYCEALRRQAAEEHTRQIRNDAIHSWIALGLSIIALGYQIISTIVVLIQK